MSSNCAHAIWCAGGVHARRALEVLRAERACFGDKSVVTWFKLVSQPFAGKTRHGLSICALRGVCKAWEWAHVQRLERILARMDDIQNKLSEGSMTLASIIRGNKPGAACCLPCVGVQRHSKLVR